ncbi:MAG TPA: hypothetical protein PK467_20495, partial [Candidatus Wallbacteria bacterium]|nr:hypothetical protein [Candidatus Wallbacteria bacterium]
FDLKWTNDDTFETDTTYKYKVNFEDSSKGGFTNKTANCADINNTDGVELSQAFDNKRCLLIKKGTDNTKLDFRTMVDGTAAKIYNLKDYKYINFAYCTTGSVSLDIVAVVTVNSEARDEIIEVCSNPKLINKTAAENPGVGLGVDPWDLADFAGKHSNFLSDGYWHTVTINFYEQIKQKWGKSGADGAIVREIYFYGENPTDDTRVYLDNFSISSKGMAQCNIDLREGWHGKWTRWEDDTHSATINYTYTRTFDSPEDGTTYFFRGRSIDNSGNMEPTTPAEEENNYHPLRITSVKTPPDPPTNLRWEALDDDTDGITDDIVWKESRNANANLSSPENLKLRAAWDPPKDASDITDYYIQIATSEAFTKKSIIKE